MLTPTTAKSVGCVVHFFLWTENSHHQQQKHIGLLKMDHEIQPRKVGMSFVLQEFPVAMGARMVGVGNRLLETALARGANNDFREVPTSEMYRNVGIDAPTRWFNGI